MGVKSEKHIFVKSLSELPHVEKLGKYPPPNIKKNGGSFYMLRLGVFDSDANWIERDHIGMIEGGYLENNFLYCSNNCEKRGKSKIENLYTPNKALETCI